MLIKYRHLNQLSIVLLILVRPKSAAHEKIGVWVSLKKRFVVFPDLEKSLFSTLFVDYEQMDETDPFTSFSEVCCCGCSNFRL